MRHLISGIDCAIAGAANVAAPAAPIPVTLRNSLRFMESIPAGYVIQPSCRGLRPAWNIRLAISIPEGAGKRKKARSLNETGLVLATLDLDQPLWTTRAYASDHEG